MKILRQIVRDRSGATAIEYGLIMAVLAIGLTASLQGLRSEIGSTFGFTSSTFVDAFE